MIPLFMFFSLFEQLIMSKAAGGPVAPKQKQHWDED
jgi:hypothetical protein